MAKTEATIPDKLVFSSLFADIEVDWSAALLGLTFSPSTAAAAALVAVLLWVAAAAPLPANPKQFCTLQLGITSQRWQHQLYQERAESPDFVDILFIRCLTAEGSFKGSSL